MIYLDNAASTPLHKELQESIPKAFSFVGNAQSLQMRPLHDIIDKSKQQVCHYFNGDPSRIFFTSGATESISTIIVGAAKFYQKSGKHLITFATEHASSLAAHQYLEREGFKITILPVNDDGSIAIDVLEAALTDETLLVSLNHVCNETGIVHDLDSIIALKNKYGFMVHLDACQTIGKTTLDVQKHPVDFISLSAHKCYGPQGIGAMYIQNNRHIQPIVHGNHSVRSGTLSHGLIALMGQAYDIAKRDMENNLRIVLNKRQRFIKNMSDIDHIIHAKYSVPHIVNIAFPNASKDNIQSIRDNIYCQVSSACHAGSPSHVLKAWGIPLEIIKRSIRFSFSIYTTDKEIDTACQVILNALS